MKDNPEEAARAALKAHQEQQGMTFDNPDEPVTSGDAGMVVEWDG